MSNELATITNSQIPELRAAGNSAMARLPGRQQKFVLALMQQGVNRHAIAKAAVEAGFTREWGYRLMREESVLAAVREESTKKLSGAALLGVEVMIKIAQDDQHKDQFQAAKTLMAINGFTAEQRIVVEHIDKDAKDLIGRIRTLADSLGLDARLLIEQAGVVIDADFEEVTQAEVDTSDW